MVKELFICLCTTLVIRNLCALDIIFNCCDIYKFYFIQNTELCTANHENLETKQITRISKFAQTEHIEKVISFNCGFINTSTFSKGLISQFDGWIAPINDNDFEYCFQQLSMNPNTVFVTNYIESILVSCTPQLHSITMITDEYTESSYFTDVAISAPILYQLNWHMHRKCHDVFDIISKLKHLKIMILDVYNSIDRNNCEHFGFNGITQLTTLHINLNKPSYFNNINPRNYALNAKFLNDMKNLTEFKLNCESDKFEVYLPKETFLGSDNLSTISLERCNFINITAEHFEHLTNLSVLNLNYAKFDNFDWLSSETLASHLKSLNIKSTSNKTSKRNFDAITHLSKYKYLNTFSVNKNIYSANTLCNGKTCSLFVDRFGTKCPTGCTCTYKLDKLDLKIICSSPEAVRDLKELPRSYGHGSTALHLNNLNLTQLPNRYMTGYSSVQELYLVGNRLENLTIHNLPENLTILDIRENNFQLLSPEVLDCLEQRKHKLRIQLSDNPWICDCQLGFMKFMENNYDMITDYKHNKCGGMTACRLGSLYLVLLLLILFVAVYLTVFWFRITILLWLYDHDIFLNCIRVTATNIEIYQRFDAFLAFSHKNLDLVNEYVEQLENGRRVFKLCFYHRDWLIGESIPACILQSIEDSRRIILLMTKEFVKSSWGTFEFRTAIKATSMNRHKRLIIIVYPEVQNFNDLDTELRLYMKYNTYLRRDDPQFWRKLIYAMPHKKTSNPIKKSNQNAEQEAEI